MPKKSIFSIFALTVLAGAVIFFGMENVESRKEEMLRNNDVDVNVSAEGLSTDETASGKTVEEADLNRLSLEQFLQYKMQTANEARLTYYGDVALDRTGIAEWNDYLTQIAGDGLVIEDATYPGFDTYELYIQQTTSQMADLESDVILFFLPAFPDKDRDMGLAESEQYLTSLINGIQAATPESLLIVVEPHIMGGEAAEWNSRSLGYTNYLESMRGVARQYGLPIFGVHDSFEERIENGSISPADILAENGTDLNENGEQLHSQILEEWAAEELDTAEYVE